MKASGVFACSVGVFGLSEAAVAERLSDLLADSNPAIALSARTGGEIRLDVQATAESADRAEALCEPILQEIRDRLGVFVYGWDIPDLQTAVVHLLREQQLKIATAESCTAGMLSGKLTQVSGASAVFECGVAAYSKDIKRDVLGVDEAIMNEQGTVCADTAAGMAIGARRVGGSDIGIGITGEAGPHPSEDKPVGTVFIALADARRVWVKELHAAGDRDTIREVATCQALDLARRYLEALPSVMAGGQLLDEMAPPPVQIPQAAPTGSRRLLASLFPWRGDAPRVLALKSLIWTAMVGVLAAAAILLNTYVFVPARNREQYIALEQLYTQEPTDYSSADFPAGMLARFYALYHQNPDIKGWVKVEDTGLNYPVVQNSALDYSSLNFKRETSEYGVPYFDQNVSLSSPLSYNRAFIIHGNNTGDGQMFSDLLSYTDARFFLSHPVVEMNTIYATGQFQVFAVLYVDDTAADEFNYRTTTFSDSDDFLVFTDALRSRSLFNTSIELHGDDTLLLLTTDAAELVGTPHIRLVVAARLLSPGESAVEEIGLSYNANVQLPTAMLPTATTTGPALSGSTRYQSSDSLPSIDPPRDDTNDTTADTTNASNDTTTPTAPTTAEQGGVTTAPSATTPTVSETERTESAFYRTLTVRIGSNMSSAVRSREELQYAVASAVKSEMGVQPDLTQTAEAYKAQAVACYTYMLYTCRDGSVFSIPVAIDLSNADDRHLYELTGEVLGIKLVDKQATTVADTPLCAMYFSSCRGVTANAQSVYAAAYPYLRSVVSAYDTADFITKYSGGTDRLMSTYTISWAELKPLLDNYVRSLPGLALADVQLEDGGDTPLYVTAQDAGGYVTRTNAYYMQEGRRVYLRGIDIRKAVGANALRSHNFTVSGDEDALTFTVAGHGLGLGMSQYGAMGYAGEAGWTWQQILTHYYSLADSDRYGLAWPVWEATA